MCHISLPGPHCIPFDSRPSGLSSLYRSCILLARVSSLRSRVPNSPTPIRDLSPGSCIKELLLVLFSSLFPDRRFIMRRHSPAYQSPPRRGYGGRGRSPPRRKYGGGGRRESGQSLLVRNIPLNCRAEDLRIPFERYGRVRDVYLPKDYYSGEPRGFAFVEFVDPYDAAEAQYHMNRQRFGGREITVVVAAETRKRPEDMRHRARIGGPSRYDGRHSARYGRSRSRSRSRSPYYRPTSRVRQTSRSYSPAPRGQDDYSPSPRRHSDRARSPRDYPEGRDGDYNRRSQSLGYSGDHQNRTDNGHAEKDLYDKDRRHSGSRSPRRASGSSPPGSRSRSADLSPGRGR